MRILITGGTGLIGRAFIKRYSNEHEFVVVSRSANKVMQLFPTEVNNGSVAHMAIADLASLTNIDAVINLAGEPIADKRWSNAQKQKITSSRWEITRALVDWIKHSDSPPKVMLSGSAIGYYGRQNNQPVAEDFTDIHHEFSHEICAQWEAIAQEVAELTRLCIMRTGVVLSADGGAVSKMLTPFKLGLGGPVSSGEQGFSWIHIDDMVAGIAFLLENPDAKGIYNFTAPTPVSNKVFSKSLAKTLGRPCVFTVPKITLRLMLGEGADLLLTGQFVVPNRLQADGFEFTYKDVDSALGSLF